MKRNLMLLALMLWPLGALADAGAPFLWEIKGPHATHYLLGSVHMLPAESQPLPLALENAYEKTQGVIFETDIAALGDPKTQMSMLASASAPKGIKSLIGPALYKKLAQNMAALQMPLDACEYYKPWFCAMTLEVLSFEHAGFEPQYGLDQVFYLRAQRDDKAVHWLEAPQAHLNLFAQMPDKLATDFLSVTLDELSDTRQSPHEMFRMWRDNDIATLEKITLGLKLRQPRAYARLLSNRSREWIKPLSRHLSATTPQLIVVGAAHLVGPDGLLKLLQQAGYEIRAVAAETPSTEIKAPSTDPLPASSVAH